MMQDWFIDAKFGIFIHWGIYSTGKTGVSWDFFQGLISHEDYMAQKHSFTADNYDPEAWAKLFADCGATYAVLTAKHHDGFALWDTQLSTLNAKDDSPAGRDLIGPFCEALRRHGLKVGIYYSHLDWSHPDYASIMPQGPQHAHHVARRNNPFGYPQGAENPEAWERFLEFHRGQLKELCERYKPDLLWFDGDWERDPDQWHFEELREQLQQWSPGVILNGRMGKFGDYHTPEQSIPVRRPQGPWEFCVTMNDSWNYRLGDNNYKSAAQCLWMLAECASLGGNLLLDIGPMADGTLPEPQVDILRQIQAWMDVNSEAIIGSREGLPAGHFYGASTLNATSDILYLIAFNCHGGTLSVKGIRNKIRRASILGGGDVTYRVLGGAPWANLPGVLWVDVPQSAPHPLATVIKIELENSLDLYSGEGDAITIN